MSSSIGLEACKKIERTGSIDIAGLDREMLVMIGVELVNRIRSNEKFRNIFIILLTVREQNRNVLDSFEYRVDDFLLKPVVVEKNEG
ncbi:MAG: response regulator [Candidatus Thermoplasmatota archaeon]|nr:response regulator [Candidatus Thermoplasmatota archaeon]